MRDEYFNGDQFGPEMGVAASAITAGASVAGKIFKRVRGRIRKTKLAKRIRARLGKRFKKLRSRIKSRIRQRRGKGSSPARQAQAAVPTVTVATRPAFDMRTLAIAAGLLVGIPLVIRSFRK